MAEIWKLLVFNSFRKNSHRMKIVSNFYYKNSLLLWTMSVSHSQTQNSHQKVINCTFGYQQISICCLLCMAVEWFQKLLTYASYHSFCFEPLSMCASDSSTVFVFQFLYLSLSLSFRSMCVCALLCPSCSVYSVNVFSRAVSFLHMIRNEEDT